jgi:hypothetical protein
MWMWKWPLHPVNPNRPDGSTYPPLHNPLAPLLSYTHFPIFHRFKPWEGPLNTSVLVDFLGVRTDPTYDCPPSTADGMTYFEVVPSRRIPCEDLARTKRVADHVFDHVSGHLQRGYLPPVDDEYWEYADLLESVVIAAESGRGRMGIVEVGARYGTWIARGAMAFRALLGDDAQVDAVGVESHPVSLPWFREHMVRNGLDKMVKLLVGHADLNDSTSSPKKYSLQTILGSVAADIIDYLDTDCQGCENTLFDDPIAQEQLVERVAKIHIGTHGAAIHEKLKRLFTEQRPGKRWSWTLRLDFVPMDPTSGCDGTIAQGLQREVRCMTFTTKGPVYIRDGLLVVTNNLLVDEAHILNHFV